MACPKTEKEIKKAEKMAEYGIMLAILNQLYHKGEFTDGEYKRLKSRFDREYRGSIGPDFDHYY